MSAADWATALDAFEARIAAQWAVLHDGSLEPVPPFDPPAAATALPEHLVTRATELVQRCRALEDALSAALTQATHQLEDLDATTHSSSAPAEPVFFDSRV